MQIAVPLVLPLAWSVSLMSLLKLDDPVAVDTLSPLILAATLAFGYCMRIAANKAATASTRPVPRFAYGLAGLCFFALTVVLAPVSYAYSHVSGSAAISVTVGFVAFYCAIAGVLCLGRALSWGSKRLAFWVFLPRWLLDSQRPGTEASAMRPLGRHSLRRNGANPRSHHHQRGRKNLSLVTTLWGKPVPGRNSSVPASKWNRSASVKGSH